MPDSCSLTLTREPGRFIVDHAGYPNDYTAALAAAAVLEVMAAGSADLPPDADGSGDPVEPPAAP